MTINTIKDLIAILDAQSGVKPIKNEKLYKEKLSKISQYLEHFAPNSSPINSKHKKGGIYHFKIFSGGVKEHIYKEVNALNKSSSKKEMLELTEKLIKASKNHKKAARNFQEKKPRLLVETFLSADKTLLQ